MSDQIPIFDPVPQTQDEIEEKKRLKAIFADMESKQLDFLDDAGKSIIERIALFLTVLFGVAAFGGSSTSAFLKGNGWDKSLVIVILGCYLIAIGMAIWAIQPRSHNWRRYDTKQLADLLAHMIAHKKRWVQWAGILFVLGTVALAILIILIIFAPMSK